METSFIKYPDSDLSEYLYEENGVKILLQRNHSLPNKCNIFFNKKMRISRELSLAAVGAYCSTVGEQNKPVECLDAFAASGITGLQWKYHLREDVSVTINDYDAEVFKKFEDTLNHNEFSIDSRKKVMGRLTSDTENNMHDQADGAKNNFHDQAAMEARSIGSKIRVTNLDSRILMCQQHYQFIHIDAFGCPVPYLDAAFHNIHGSGGILIVTATDVATLYGKCPRTLLRNYGCRVSIATDYVKELAVRILISTLVRAGGRCKKGVRVLYSAAVEHFVQVGVEVYRGAEAADKCLSQIHEILLCRVCQQTSVLPETQCLLTGELSSLLPCACRQESDTIMAVLGPIWCGSIFTSSFINLMSASCQQFNLSKPTLKLLKLLKEEGEFEETSVLRSQATYTYLNGGRTSVPSEVETGLIYSESSLKSKFNQSRSTEASSKLLTKDSAYSKNTSQEISSAADMLKCPVLQRLIDQEHNNCDSLNSLCLSSSKKRLSTEVNSHNTCSENNDSAVIESVSQDIHCTDNEAKNVINHHGLFFVRLHRRGITGVNLPRVKRLIAVLRAEGYRACPTHFDSQAVRTTASGTQVMRIINQLSLIESSS